MASNNPTSISRNQFEHYVEAAAELLGESHTTTQLLRSSLKSGDSHEINRGMALIRNLPTAQRDRILIDGKHRATEDSKLQEWLMQQVGSPTTVPPDRNVH